jgi:hypothetical protein
MSSKDLECYECAYNAECPAGWSRHNAACLTIRKPYEATMLYNILNDIFSGKKLDDEMKEQINWDYMAHMDIRE